MDFLRNSHHVGMLLHEFGRNDPVLGMFDALLGCDRLLHLQSREQKHDILLRCRRPWDNRDGSGVGRALLSCGACKDSPALHGEEARYWSRNTRE